MTPIRMTTYEVMELTRWSRATLRRRIRAGDFPAPICRARQSLFCRSEVLAHLEPDSELQRPTAWDVNPTEIKRIYKSGELQRAGAINWDFE